MKNQNICDICHHEFNNAKGLSNHLRYGGCHGFPPVRKRYRSKKPYHFKYGTREEAYRRLSIIHMNDKNLQWKGDKVGYTALHNWIKRRFAKPDSCSNCQKTATRIDLANISQEYKRELSDWEWLCRKCHMLKDGRMNNLKQYATL